MTVTTAARRSGTHPTEGPGADARRPSVAFVAWTPIGGRSEEIASALGGEARCFYDERRRFGKLSVAARYVRSAAGTVGYLRRCRPEALIATNPPLVPGLIAWAYARRTGARVALDSHPGGFGLQGDRLSALLQPLHRWLARRVTTTLVTDDRLADRVRGWGGTADILHEAPMAFDGTPRGALRSRPRVLFVCIFQRDEPVAAVVEAARAVPELDVEITGDTDRAPAGMVAAAPPNVRFTGFLTGKRYESAVLDADLVLALTTEPSSVVRAGYEAVYARRPLVVTDWPASRAVFPHAVYVANDAAGIATGLRRAIAEHDRLVDEAPAALALQRARWADQLAALRRRLTETPTNPPR